MQRIEKDFARKVYAIVAQIPKGKVMTYGQIAGMCGNAQAARIVGGVAHFGPPDLPWQRVVNKKGGLAAGYYDGRAGQKRDLEADGITLTEVNGEFLVDLNKYLYQPK